MTDKLKKQLIRKIRPLTGRTMRKVDGLFYPQNQKRRSILVVAFIAVAFLATQKSADYYTQIDNDCVTEIAPHGAMNYRYTLSAYDETGAEKELNFETSRILTDDAYLCLKVAPFRGVVTWAEVQFDEMPAAVQEQYGGNS